MEDLYVMREGHEVLQEDHCSGFRDQFGEWNNGFPCPSDDGRAMYCCGHDANKYCCVSPIKQVEVPLSPLTIILAVVFVIVVGFLIVFMISCFKCACCLLYKKRQPGCGEGPLYQMHCSSNSSGVAANVYSTSRASTPGDVSESHHSRSRLTADSSRGSYRINGSVDGNSRTGTGYHSNSSRPESMFSDLSTSTMSDITVRDANLCNYARLSERLPYHAVEPPPPYSAHHSTLVAVRNPASHPNPSTSYFPNNTLGIDRIRRPFNSDNTSHLSTFNPPPALTAPSQAIAALAAANRLSAAQLNHLPTISGPSNTFGHIHRPLQPNGFASPLVPALRQSRAANIINTSTNATDEQRMYSATKF